MRLTDVRFDSAAASLAQQFFHYEQLSVENF